MVMNVISGVQLDVVLVNGAEIDIYLKVKVLI